VPPTRPRAVYFDLDQTLVQHTRPIVALAKEALQRQAPKRFPCGPEFETALAEGGAALWQRISEYQGRGEQALTDMLAYALASAGLNRSLATPLFRELLLGIADSTRPTMNAGATLDALTATGLSLGIITNGFTILQTHKARAHGLVDRVQSLVTSEDAGAHKPNPRIFEFALNELGVQATEAWYVGDNCDKDVRGAARAGLTSVLFDPDGQYDARKIATTADAPDYVIRDLIEVVQLTVKLPCAARDRAANRVRPLAARLGSHGRPPSP
jgi:putative hydrolase of the HAD superfamily